MKPIILGHFGRRTALIQMLRERGAKIGAEIGTDRGQYAEELFGGIPDLELICVDPWLPYTEGKEIYNQIDMDDVFKEAMTRLSRHNSKIMKMTSMEAVKQIPDESLDFVFIDGNHEYNYVLEDITEWTKKVKSGGVVAGHDYVENSERYYGVIEAVNEYISRNKVAPLFILNVPSHVPKRKKGNFVDCWMFIKP